MYEMWKVNENFRFFSTGIQFQTNSPVINCNRTSLFANLVDIVHTKSPKGSKHGNMSKFEWSARSVLSWHGNETTGSCFSSARPSPELHSIRPDLVRGTLWTVILHIFRLNHVKTSMNFINAGYSNWNCHLKKVRTKYGYHTSFSFMHVQQYAAPKSSVQKSNIGLFSKIQQTIEILTSY